MLRTGEKENGRDVATRRTAKGWSTPAFFAITGGSWGLQIGMEGIDLVMIVQNEKGMQRLIGSGFQLGADASAAAGPLGRHASANTNWKLDAEVLTYSRAKGALAGLTLNGASVRCDDDSTEAISCPTSPRVAFCAARLPLQLRPIRSWMQSRGAKAQAVAEK